MRDTLVKCLYWHGTWMAALLATGRGMLVPSVNYKSSTQSLDTFCIQLLQWLIWALCGMGSTSAAAPGETGDLPRPVACLQQRPVADIKGRACE